MKLSRYPEYTDSGVDWIGPVPSHWGIKRLKTLASQVTDKATEKRRPVGLENIEGWSGRFISTDADFQGDGVAFNAGDILFGKLRPYLAKVYLADSCGEAVGDFHVVRPLRMIEGRYLQYVMLSRSFIDIVDGSTFGSKMPRASWEALGGMPVAVPRPEEQLSIATFLDRETTKIDVVIAEQERLLELLAEKRQAAISHVVTMGLNPDAPTKNSGIDWFGQVPAHWEVSQLRRVVLSFEQGWSPDCESRPAEGSEWGVLKAGCVNGGRFAESENKALPPSLSPRQELMVNRGDLLMSRASGSPKLIGSVAVVEQVSSRLMLSDKIFRLKVAPGFEPRFLALVMGSFQLRQQIEQSIGGAEGLANNLPQSRVKELWIPVPPQSEQDLIVSEVDGVSRGIRELEAATEAVIALLKERRSAMISAAVTGQIDVRDVA